MHRARVSISIDCAFAALSAWNTKFAAAKNNSVNGNANESNLELSMVYIIVPNVELG